MARDYLLNMRRGEAFSVLSEEEQDKVLFEAEELLRDVYPAHRITDRAIALQTAYMLEGEEEEFATLKRHGVESASTKGVSLSFRDDADLIAPEVRSLLGDGGQARTGRLV